MNIAKGKIGNALTSTADNHVVAVANDIYDEERKKYQSQINKNSVIGKDDEGREVYLSEVTELFDTDEYIAVTIDREGKILEVIKSDGTKETTLAYSLLSVDVLHIPNEEWLQVTIDRDYRILEGVRVDGTKYIAKLENPTFDSVKKEISENIWPQLDELSKKIAENVFAIEVGDEGNLVAVIDEDSNVTDVGITNDGDIYADFNIE